MSNDIFDELKGLNAKQLAESLSLITERDRKDSTGQLRAFAIVERGDQGVAYTSLVATPDQEYYGGSAEWETESPICQYGVCNGCSSKLTSWAKHVLCPVCGRKVCCS